MTRLDAAARRIAQRAAERARARIASALREQWGEAVGEDGGGVAIEGRGLTRRLLAEPVLRWTKGMLR